MPFLFIIVGILLTTSAVRDTVADFGAQNEHKGLASMMRQDFTGKSNFLYWTFAILLIGALGYIKPLQNFSRAFMVLIVIVLLLANKGFFTQFTQALNATQATQKEQGIHSFVSQFNQ